MTEDRLRALRAIRFSARFDFDLHPDTWQAIVDSAPFLARLSPERVKQELEKTMEQVRHPSTAMRRWQTSGAFASLIPGLVSVSDDVLRAIDCLPLPGPPTKPQRKLLRLAALMSEMTAVECEQALRALRFSNADIAWVSALVGCWQREGAALARELREPGDISQARLRRLAASVGRLRCAAFVRLAAARWSTQQPSPEPARVRALYRRLLHVAFHEPVEVADLAINGDDLRALGVRPGPQLGRLLSELLELVLDDPARNTVAWLHAFVSERQRAGAANA
jgi:tRNA nucleotidyltransferase (CCA-adding enzyme)